VTLSRSWIIATCAALCAALAPTTASAATYRMVIQAHADVGGKCLNIPNRQFVDGMRLETFDCNNTAAQIFSYDDKTQELKIGNLCVTSWGRGDPQDAVGIESCHAVANQHWRMVAVKDYYQLIGINNRCLEVRYGVNSNGAPLDVMDCDANRAQRLWALVEAPPAPAETAGCQTDNYTFSVPDSRSATTNSVSTGGGACIYTPHPRPEVQWTSVSIIERPQNGTFEQTGEYAFKYQPRSGFKGQDEYAMKICGRDPQSSGCATITYRVTVK